MDKYTANALKKITETYGIFEAPSETKRHGEWIECVLPIGADEVAFLTMTKEAYDSLCKIGTFETPRNPPTLEDKPFA